MKAQYRVIANPNNIFGRYEVWYAGKAATRTEEGYMEVKDVCKQVRSFLTERGANNYVQYEESVRAFKETVETTSQV